MGGTQQYSPEDPVIRQYDRWQYPHPADDLRDPAVADYLRSYGTLAALAPIYWPRGAPGETLDVLVAGCGTMAAAAYALLNPHCRVVGIDLSAAAIEHENRLKARHGLTNLSLHILPIEDVATLKMTFDFIGCQGVLHHMPDPAAGLRALGEVLRPDGVVAIMLYARYGRIGVYMLQEFFRLLNVEQTDEGLALVRQTLAHLPAEHPARQYLHRATDLNSDAGLVDTFLHRRDRAYSAAECVSLVRDAGLSFGGWDRKYFYYSEGPYRDAPQLRDRIAQLPEEQIWRAMDVACVPLGTHYFHAFRADRDPAAYQIPWERPELLKCVPMVSAKLVRLQASGKPPTWAMAQGGVPPVPLSDPQASIFSRIDGRRSLGECAQAAGITGDEAALHAASREFFRLVWRCGFGVLRW